MTKEERKERNQKLITERTQKYKDRIQDSVVWSMEYPEIIYGKCTIMDTDSVSALIKISEEADGVVVLNFASFLSPGGGFANGAKAQEESLCEESYLYNVLSDESFKKYYEGHQKHKNKGLYSDEMILTPDVTFIRNGKEYNAHVLTCAAPNYKVFKEHGGSEFDAVLAYIHRVELMYQTITDFTNNDGYVTHFIAGAWGCGVFGFDVEKAIKIFQTVAKNQGFDTILAIPNYKKK